MRSRELFEAGVGSGAVADYNFGDTARSALGAVGAVAKKAYTGLKAHGQKVLDAEKKAAEQAAREAEKAKKEADRAQQLADKEAAKKDKATKKQRVASALDDTGRTAGNIILSDDPTPETLGELNDFGPGELELFKTSLSAVEARFARLPAVFKKALTSSDVLTDDQKKDLEGRLDDQDQKTLPAAAVRLAKNQHGEQQVWKLALSSDDDIQVGKALVELFRKIAEHNTRHNQAVHTQAFRTRQAGEPAPSFQRIGTAILNLMSAERQLIAKRLQQLKGAVTELQNNPQNQPEKTRFQELAGRAKDRVAGVQSPHVQKASAAPGAAPKASGPAQSRR